MISFTTPLLCKVLIINLRGGALNHTEFTPTHRPTFIPTPNVSTVRLPYGGFQSAQEERQVTRGGDNKTIICDAGNRRRGR